MSRLLARFLSPLRRIDADPDQLVVEAHALLQRVDANEGLWAANTALSVEALAKVSLATYLQQYRPE